MKNLFLIATLFLVACSSTPLRRPALVGNDQYGQISAGDKKLNTEVVLIPQWHLAPMTNTTNSSAGLPQSENQRAIYRQLVEWVEGGQVKTVIVEGCEGEIQDGFADRFNGWTLEDLQKLSAEQLDNVMTQVGLKLKAKVGQNVRVLCGDRLDLVKRHQLILSDMRGLLGFKLRIEQYKDDAQKRADYVATARDLLKMPKESDEAAVLSKINDQLRQNLKDFTDVLHQRDESFVATVKKATSVDAIVVGAIHIDDLQHQLHDAKFAAQTFTPRGLKGDESELLTQIQALLAPPPPAK